MEDDTIFNYKCTELYNPKAERGIMWNDPDLNVDWKFKENEITNPIIAEKDQKNMAFKDLK